MPSDTDVVNIAMRHVGASRILNLTEGSPEANVANDIYADLVRSLLRSHIWNFATKRLKLAQSSTAPIFEFDHAYPVPSEWLRTISCHADSDGRSSIAVYRMELVSDQRAIVTDADDVYLRYVAEITDPNLWNADFVEAVASALARDLSIPLAASNTMRDEYRKIHIREINRAKSSDAMESTPTQRPRGSWVTARGRRIPNVGTVD